MLSAQFFIASLGFVLGFYALYNTSLKVAPQKYVVVQWGRLNARWIKPLALTMLLAGFYSFGNVFGLGLGLVFGFILLMACASIQIMLLPFKRGQNSAKAIK